MLPWKLCGAWSNAQWEFATQQLQALDLQAAYGLSPTPTK